VAEKMVMVGVLPDAVTIDPGDQVTWFSNAGNLKVEFDPQRCPFSGNVFQAPPGIRLTTGPTRAGVNSGSYKYRISLNDVVVCNGEVVLRSK
jgi:plastocyanin